MVILTVKDNMLKNKRKDTLIIPILLVEGLYVQLMEGAGKSRDVVVRKYVGSAI